MKRTCSVPECERTDRITRGMCSMHYQRMRNLGTTDCRARPDSTDALRPCSRCKRTLPLVHFQNRKKHGWKCTTCVSEARRAYHLKNGDRIRELVRARRALDPERFRQINRESRLRHREAVNARQREYWATKGSKDAAQMRREDPRGYRDRHMRSRYGITLEQYEDLADRQGGLCSICHTPTERLCVDHCHNTGRVRGLLCNNCNGGIGLLQDDPFVALRAVQYLLGELGDDGLVLPIE